MSRDKLFGNVVEVVADNLRLRTDSQHIIADTLDQRGLPARRDGAESVPCMAGDRQSCEGSTRVPFRHGRYTWGAGLWRFTLSTLNSRSKRLTMPPCSI